MTITIILCVIGVSLIALGGYLWYLRRLEDENSFGDHDIRWEHIDDGVKPIGPAKAIETPAARRRQADGSEQAHDVDSAAEELDKLLLGEEERTSASHETTDAPAMAANTSSHTRSQLDDNPAMIVSVHVVAKPGREFGGAELQAAFSREGLAHGDRGIFHYYDSEHADAPIRFSIANMLEPGSFDLAKIDDIKTHGITLFMLLPGDNNNVMVFEKLLDCARRLAQQLGGELRDSQRNVLTAQGADLIRESIHRFYSRRDMRQERLNL